jgi:hypothetical protein
MEYRDGLVALTPDNCQSLADPVTGWKYMNEQAPVLAEVKSDPYLRSNAGLTMPDIAKSGDYICAAGVDRDTLELKVSFYHVDAPFVPVSGPTTVVTLGANTSFSLLAHADRFFLAFADTTNIRVYVCNPSTSFSFALGGSITGLATTPTTPLLCPGVDNTSVCMAFMVLSGISFNEVSIAGVPAGSSTLVGTVAGVPLALALVNGSVLSGYIAVSSQGEIVVCATDYSGATEVATIAPGTIASVLRASIVQYSAVGGYYVAYSGKDFAQTSNYDPDVFCTYVQNVSQAHALQASGYIPGTVLVGKLISTYAIDPDQPGVIVPVGHAASAATAFGATLGYSYYSFGLFMRPTVDGSDLRFNHAGTFLADKLYHQDSAAATNTPDYRLVSHAIVDSEVWMPATVTIATVESAGATWGVGFQTDLVRARFTTPRPGRSATARSLRMLASGAGVIVTDGVHVADNTPPPAGRAYCTETYTGEVMPVAGYPGAAFQTSRYKFLWRWRDAAGNIHRGPIGEYVEVPLLVGAGAPGVTYAFKVTMCAPTPQPVTGDRGTTFQLECYATGDVGGAGDGIYRLVAVVTPEADPDRDGYVFVWVYGGNSVAEDNYIGGTSPSQPVLYTEDSEGAELEPNPIPPLTDITSTQSRVWILPAQDRLTVRPSKPLTLGYAPEFNAALDVQIPEEGGDCVAIASLGNRIAVFKERQIYSIFGEPGGASGDGATVGVPELIVGDLGCINPLSVVEVLPLGVAFLSQDGFALITPSGEIRRIGDAVQDTLGDREVTSAVLVPEDGEIRWTVSTSGVSSDTNTLVWNYQRDVWTRWTGLEAQHSCAFRGVQARLVSGTGEIVYDTDTWADATHTMSVTIPWLKFAGTQGLQRIYRALFLLRWYTGGVQISECIDYDDAVLATHTWKTTDDPDYVAGTDLEVNSLDAENGRVQLSIDPLGSKCEAMKLTIAETYFTPDEGDPDPDYGRGFELVGLDLVVGTKRGTYRHKQADGGKG